MISTWSSHDAHAVLYVREKRAQHHVWMSGRHGDGWHGNSLEAQGQAPEEASWRLRWGLSGGFCGGLRGGLRGVSGGLRGVSVPVFVGSPRGLRGSPGVSAPRWHTKHYRAQLRARDTTCTETLFFHLKCPRGVCQGDRRAPRDVCCSFLEKRLCNLPLKLKKRKRRV